MGSVIWIVIPGSGPGSSMSHMIPLYPCGFNGWALFSQWGSTGLFHAQLHLGGRVGSASVWGSPSESASFLSVWGSSRNSWSPFLGSRSDLSQGIPGALTPAVFAWPQVIALDMSLIGVMSLGSETHYCCDMINNWLLVDLCLFGSSSQRSTQTVPQCTSWDGGLLVFPLWWGCVEVQNGPQSPQNVFQTTMSWMTLCSAADKTSQALRFHIRMQHQAISWSCMQLSMALHLVPDTMLLHKLPCLCLSIAEMDLLNLALPELVAQPTLLWSDQKHAAVHLPKWTVCFSWSVRKWGWDGFVDPSNTCWGN